MIDFATQNDRPFLLLLAHHAPHTPIEAKAEDIAYFQSKTQSSFRHKNATYAGMIRSLDNSVGRIVARLRDLKQLDNTIIVFTSDNGGYIGNDSAGKLITDNHPLRSGKGSLYEGGIRVPLIMHWPNRLQGNSIRTSPVVLTDLFPTLLSMTGTSSGDSVDGMNLLPYLESNSKPPARQSLMFHYPHYYHAPKTTPCGAIRHENWKLIEYFEDHQLELYDLATDPIESNNLAVQNPTKLDELKHKLSTWRDSVSAKMPRQNNTSSKATN